MSVGPILRQRREDLAMDLGEIAEYLRIRLGYLEAIENEEFGGLPGGAYAIGFVKTYARTLGLDEVKLADLFRKEQADAMRKTPLTVRRPLADSRIPATGILVLALVLGAGGWIVWSYLERGVGQPVETVPPVPERLKPQGQDQTAASPTPPPAAEEAVAPAPPPVAANSALSTAASGPVTQPALGQPVGPVPEPAPAIAAASAGTVATPPAGDATPPPPSHAAPGAMPFTTPVESEPDEARNDTDAPEQGPNVHTGPAPDAPAGKVYGAAEGPSRVQIRAVADSWIQIHDPAHATIYTGVLHPGDVYRVPDQPGYTFVTGNAGGVELVENGTAGPPLGREGQVLRNVKLTGG